MTCPHDWKNFGVPKIEAYLKASKQKDKFVLERCDLCNFYRWIDLSANQDAYFYTFDEQTMEDDWKELWS